jgi:hypothetical protein
VCDLFFFLTSTTDRGVPVGTVSNQHTVRSLCTKTFVERLKRKEHKDQGQFFRIITVVLWTEGLCRCQDATHMASTGGVKTAANVSTFLVVPPLLPVAGNRKSRDR